MPSGTRPLPGPLSIEVARILAASVRANDVAQADVAAAAGMSASQLSRILAGLKPLTLDQLDALCTALGDDVVQIISEADASTRAATHADNVSPFRRRNVGTPAQDVGDLAAVARPADPEPTDEQPSYDDPS
ncbi:hypothetical protein CSIV_14420 [Microbacterium sp. CSI-V]|uniref:helix-turn-helix domain-containing protein n=1 Tax=Microbacterium sp. CSI-V TaxID=1933777 RepID=UPI00097C85AA|nr:helix-turn-helix domain-containing protein [Microbacterium sp. CSI-V]ONI62666.1 hypothetical protein CSIV_14420 [Microbacterium sp. CSI-V]